MFVADTIARKGNKSANDLIIKLIDLIGNENAVITCDLSKGGKIPSRGVVAECLVKLYYTKKASAEWSPKGSDLHYNGVDYEIKCSTSKGNAHYNPKQDLTHLIFVDQSGIYETTGANIILDKCGKHIKSIKMNRNVKTVVSF